MKACLFIISIIFWGLSSFGQQVLGDFTGNDQSEWPKVIWYRDTGNNWDEGLLKNSSTQTSVFGRAGYGIHMHESRQFTFWSSGWNPLFAIEGGTGNAYLKGNVGVGINNAQAKLHIQGGGVVIGSNAVINNTNGGLSIGSINDNYNPSTGNWSNSGSTLLLSGLDYTTIGFHDSGSRVDFIRSGNGTMEFGYDGGWGKANIGLPNGIWNANGAVGIGTTTPREALSVNGNIRSKEVKVEAGPWPDYVFKAAYRLPALSQIKAYVERNRHLPEMPSEKQVAREGINLGEMNKLLVKKVEELTLYLIEKDRELKKQMQVNQNQEKRLRKIEQKLH